MTITPEQLKEHHEGLGGSDALAYAGLDPRKTLVELYREKIAPNPPPQSEDPRAGWGKRLEPVVIDWFQEATGRLVSQPPEKAPRHADHRFLLAHLDGLLLDPEKPMEGLEVKTGGKEMSAEYGEVGTDEVPIRHVCQVMHYMMVMPEIRRFNLAVLLGGNDSRHYVVDYDAELARMLLARACAFWKQVEARSVPSPVTLEDCKYVWPTSKERQVKATDDIVGAVVEMAQLRSQARFATAKADEREVQVKTYMGEAAVLIDPNAPITNNQLVSWRTQNRNAVNLKELEAAHPDLVKQFRVTTSHRVFRIS